MRYQISTFAHARDASPVAREVSWEAVLATMSRPSVLPVRAGEDLERAKKRIPAWSPATFRPGQARSTASCEAVSMLVLDFDSEATIQGELVRWRNYRLCLHTTYSHTEDVQRFRLIIPLARPVPAMWWKRVYSWAREQSPDIDVKCKNPDRIFFKPAVREDGWPFQFEERQGELLWLQPERLAESPDERPPAPRVPLPTYRTCDPASAELERRRRFTLPYYREQLAVALGGRLLGAGTSQRAKGIPCPGCGKASIWFLIDPAKATNARCDHRNSCGWTGSLFELACAHQVAK